MNNKTYKWLVNVFILLSVIGSSFSFTQNSIEKTTIVFYDSLPAINYLPGAKRGWVGQNVYRLKYKSKGNVPAPFKGAGHHRSPCC